MKERIAEYGRTRREIRKINRETRVDQPDLKRKHIKLILIVLAIVFIIAEIFGIAFAKRLHDRELAKTLSEEATIELSLINSSLLSGDQAFFRNSHVEYQNTLSRLNHNSYVANNHADLLERLNNYEIILSREAKDSHLIKLRTAIIMLQTEIEDVDLKTVSTKSMITIKEHFEDFRDSLEKLDDDRFNSVVSELTDYSNKLIKLIDRTSVCVGTCPEKTMKARREDLVKILNDYKEKLSASDTEISRLYSPVELVESLKMLQ